MLCIVFSFLGRELNYVTHEPTSLTLLSECIESIEKMNVISLMYKI
jgi:hypothetical protein